MFFFQRYNVLQIHPKNNLTVGAICRKRNGSFALTVGAICRNGSKNIQLTSGSLYDGMAVEPFIRYKLKNH